MDYNDLVQTVTDLQQTSDDTTDTVSTISDTIDDHESRVSDIENNGAQLAFPLSQDSIDQIKQIFPVSSATLVAGVANITDSNILASSTIIYSVNKASGTQGFLSITSQTDSAMTITSTSNTDTSSINYLII
jgi:hypothetical protein